MGGPVLQETAPSFRMAGRNRSDVAGRLPGGDQIEQSGEAFVEVFCAEPAAPFQAVLALADESCVAERAKVMGE